MDLRLANNNQGSAMRAPHIKLYISPLKSRLFNGKLVILVHEMWIWLTATTTSTTHGGKLFG
jgi:hypothetical protein